MRTDPAHGSNTTATAVAAGLVAIAAIGFAVGSARAHGGEDHGHAEPKSAAAPTPGPALSGAPQRLPDGSVLLPKPAQRRLGIRTELARAGALAGTVELNGRVIADPNAGGRVQATQAGTVLPGPRGLPSPGRRVARGEVLAWLKPAGGAIERGNQKAQMAELEAQLALAEARAQRLGALEGAVPQKEIDAARVERTALARRLAHVSGSVSTNEELVAPVAGVVSAVQVVAGQVVEPRDVLFEIVDPSRLSVEALAYDVGLGSAIAGASARIDAAGDAPAIELEFVGAGLTLRDQALPLMFRIVGRRGALAVGQPVRVYLRTQRTQKGVAVAREALVRLSSGETAVWVHADAERFVAQRVRVEPLDARRVAIVDGLKDRDRVVVDGAGLLSQVR